MGGQLADRPTGSPVAAPEDALLGGAVPEAGVGSAVLLFYQYDVLGAARAASLADEQRALGADLGLCGRVLVAPEGINGTVQGSSEALAAYQAAVDSALGVNAGRPPIDWKRSEAGARALFPDFAVKEVPELVGFGLHGRRSAGGLVDRPLDVQAEAGVRLAPQDFHRLLGETPQESLRVIDVRNTFEYEVGHFDGATDPGMSHTAQWPRFVEGSLEELRGKRVMLYCTGGIRCEKASAYLRRRLRESARAEPPNDVAGSSLGATPGAAGSSDLPADSAAASAEAGVINRAASNADVEEARGGEAETEVYQLHGGIHRYLEAFPDGGLFRGANFVFDRRAQMKPQAASGCGDVPGGAGENVVGRCSECSAPWGAHDGGRVCCVCRALVLVCDDCDVASVHGEYWCAEHAALRGCYFHFVDRFGPEELRAQAAALRDFLAAEVGPKRKNRRNTLRKKIEQVECRLERLAAGEALEAGATEAAAPPRRCRACERPFAECPGACWGFWKSPGGAHFSGVA